MNSKTLLAILLMAPSCYATGHGGFENALEEGGRELAETGGQKIYNGDNVARRAEFATHLVRPTTRVTTRRPHALSDASSRRCDGLASG